MKREIITALDTKEVTQSELAGSSCHATKKILRAKLDDYDRAIRFLVLENKKLRGEIETLKAVKPSVEILQSSGNQKAERVLGFSLCQRKTGRTVAYWYAGKQVNGKQVWIYLGRDKSSAESKIKAYLTKISLGA